MNKEAMTFKVEEYTITIHRGPEESKEMEQKRMAMYATWIFNMSMKPMVKYFDIIRNDKRMQKISYKNIIKKILLIKN